MADIDAEDIVCSIADALQYVSYTHPPDFVQALSRAHARDRAWTKSGGWV